MRDLLHEALWPTHVFHRLNPDHHTIEAGLTEYALARAEAAAEAVESGVAPGSKGGLFESRFDLFDEPAEPAVAALKDFCVASLVAAVERADPSRLAQSPGTSLRIVESWIHVTGTGGYHDHHLHAFRDWCGIYYVRTGGEGSGLNRFYQPFMSMDGSRGHYDVTPEPGWLVVFPGHVAHAALPHHGSDRRIVVAFNARLHSGVHPAEDRPVRAPDHVWAYQPVIAAPERHA